MTARRASTVAVATASVAVLLAVLLVTWAASIGPNEVLRGTGPVPATTEATVEPTESASATADNSLVLTPNDGESSSVLWAIALVLNIATGAVGALPALPPGAVVVAAPDRTPGAARP